MPILQTLASTCACHFALNQNNAIKIFFVIEFLNPFLMGLATLIDSGPFGDDANDVLA